MPMFVDGLTDNINSDFINVKCQNFLKFKKIALKPMSMNSNRDKLLSQLSQKTNHSPPYSSEPSSHPGSLSSMEELIKQIIGHPMIKEMIENEVFDILQCIKEEIEVKMKSVDTNIVEIFEQIKTIKLSSFSEKSQKEVLNQKKQQILTKAEQNKLSASRNVIEQQGVSEKPRQPLVSIEDSPIEKKQDFFTFDEIVTRGFDTIKSQKEKNSRQEKTNETSEKVKCGKPTSKTHQESSHSNKSSSFHPKPPLPKHNPSPQNFDKSNHGRIQQNVEKELRKNKSIFERKKKDTKVNSNADSRDQQVLKAGSVNETKRSQNSYNFEQKFETDEQNSSIYDGSNGLEANKNKYAQDKNEQDSFTLELQYSRDTDFSLGEIYNKSEIKDVFCQSNEEPQKIKNVQEPEERLQNPKENSNRSALMRKK